MSSERFRVWVGFAIVSFVWGSTWLAIKIGLASVPPLLAVGIRFAIASTVLYGIMRARKLQVLWTAETKKLYAALIFLSYSVPYGVVYWGQQFIPSGLSSILFAAFPLWVAFFSHLLLPHERASVFKVVGIVIGMVGLVVIFAEDAHLSEVQGLLGMSAIMISTVLQGIALVLTKKWGQPVNPVVMNFVGMSAGGVLLLAASLALEPVGRAVWDVRAVGSIIYLALIGSVLVFVTYHWLLKRIQAVYLSLTSFINPIVAVILGALILDESLGPKVFAGAALVFLGILVANGKMLYARLRRA
jgi:drug/metabolite transporter (DMT)-like permease